MLHDARYWYRSRSMIAGILAGILSTAMIIVPKPFYFGSFVFLWAANNLFSVLLLYVMFLTNIALGIRTSHLCYFWSYCGTTVVVILMLVLLHSAPDTTTTTTTPNDEPANEESMTNEQQLERMVVYVTMSTIAFVNYVAFGWLALTTILFLTTSTTSTTTRQSHSNTISFQQFSFVRNGIVFVGACSVGGNTCLFLASFVIGHLIIVPGVVLVYNVTAFMALVLWCLVLTVAVSMQEQIYFQERMETTTTNTTSEEDERLDCV
jgi:hypothetical protein